MRYRRAAWQSANLMNCWVSRGQAITVDKLMGTDKREPQQDPKDAMATVREIARKQKLKKQDQMLKEIEIGTDDVLEEADVDDFAQRVTRELQDAST